MIEQLNKEAREAGFLIFGDYDDPDLYESYKRDIHREGVRQ